MYACINSKTRGIWGHAPPEEIRCSEIVSEAILEKKQNRSSYMARGVLHQNFDGPCAFAKPAVLELLREKVLWLAEQQAGTITTRTTGELLSATSIQASWRSGTMNSE